MIYLCLIAMAICCVAAGWQLRGNYDDRPHRSPIDDKPRARIPVARVLTRVEQRRLDIPTIRRIVYGKRQRIEVIDAPVRD